MKSKLPVLTTAVLLAAGGIAGYRSYQRQRSPDDRSRVQTAVTGQADTEDRKNSPVVPAQPTAGDQLIRDARIQLERRASVTARVRQQASLRDRQFRGVGGYWQKGGSDELLVRLELQIVGEEANLLQVGTGRFLWTDARLPTGRSITRLDLRKLRNEAARTADDFDEFESGHASWSQQPELSLRYGGLSSFLAALSDSFAFSPPQSMRWTPNPPLAGLPESMPVFAVVGQWKPASLAAIEPRMKEVVAAELPNRLSTLPERIPQEVLVLFGQSDLFPYRIEFRKQLSPPPAASRQIAPLQLSSEPLLCIEFEAVSFNTAIAAGQFDYLPGDAKFDDNTAEQLEKIRLQRAEKVAARQSGRQ
jgi:hypothetical protein